MSDLGGPGKKHPPDSGRVLLFRAPQAPAPTKDADAAAETVSVVATSDIAGVPQAEARSAAAPQAGTGFDAAPGTTQAIQEPVAGARQSQVRARLVALGLASGERPVKGTAQLSIDVMADGNRVLSGSIEISTPAGLLRLEGIDVVQGDVNVHEGAVNSEDLTRALKGLRQVKGRLTFEGLRSC